MAVILNALRALRPVAAAARLTDADAALTRRFRSEHEFIRADIEQLRTPPTLTAGPRTAMTRVRQAYAVLTGEIWPHENTEEAYLSLDEEEAAPGSR